MCLNFKYRTKRKGNFDHCEVEQYVIQSNFSAAFDEGGLTYKDPFVTKEQVLRDKKITELLTQYVDFYKRKVKHITACRYIILIPCIAIILAFAVLLFILALPIGNTKTSIGLVDLAAFITACVSFISLIIGLLSIITKYFFPENDEQYIAAIVESIQSNDLENKRENAKHNHREQSKDPSPIL